MSTVNWEVLKEIIENEIVKNRTWGLKIGVSFVYRFYSSTHTTSFKIFENHSDKKIVESIKRIYAQGATQEGACSMIEEWGLIR